MNTENMSKYNNEYINTFLARIEEAVDNDEVITQEDYDKAMAFYDHKLSVLQRRHDRLTKSLQKDTEKNSEALEPSTIE
jgi:hypothetical protein